MILFKTPKNFSERVVTRFAWLPTYTKSGEWVWLEKIIKNQTYHHNGLFGCWDTQSVYKMSKDTTPF